jgi:protein-L-isoaspartate(D-aspartate) O-methyltransferase
MTLSPQSEEMRRHMVDSQLRTSGVNAPWVIAAMLATPREAFLLGDTAAAYMDRAVAIDGDRVLNPPLAAGQMLMLADPKADDNILIVGAGTGYLTKLLQGRVASVVAVEESAALAKAFKENLPDVILIEGANAAGASDHGPYDVIIIDGAVERLPDAISAQLTDGGRIVTGITDGPVSRLAYGVKRNGQLVLRPMADMEIGLLPGFASAKEFVF